MQLLGGDMTFTFSPAGDCKVFMATDCNITTSTTAANLLTYRSMSSTQNKATIKAEKIAEWADRIDEEGYVYMRIHHTLAGARNITIKSAAPTEADPVYPTTTVTVACDANNRPYVEVKTAQTITITNEAGTVVQTFTDAQPDAKYSLYDLPSGTYTLQGETETITINL